MLAPMLKMQTVACTAVLLGTACAGPPAASAGDFDSPGALYEALSKLVPQGYSDIVTLVPSAAMVADCET